MEGMRNRQELFMGKREDFMRRQKKFWQSVEPIDIVSGVMLFAIVASLGFYVCYSVYSYFHPDIQNVFDQLYYEVRTVKHGGNSVLISGTESAYADYDFGSFVNIKIPELDMCLDIGTDTLFILFFNHGPNGECYCIYYKYDLEEKRLYGEGSIEYLTNYFLTDYFSWCGKAGKSNVYSRDDLGTFDFERQKNVRYD